MCVSAADAAITLQHFFGQKRTWDSSGKDESVVSIDLGRSHCGFGVADTPKLSDLSLAKKYPQEQQRHLPSAPFLDTASIFNKRLQQETPKKDLNTIGSKTSLPGSGGQDQAASIS